MKLKKDNLMSVGDHVKLHAVFVDNVENSWNLNYLGTAVIFNKNKEILEKQVSDWLNK